MRVEPRVAVAAACLAAACGFTASAPVMPPVAVAGPTVELAAPAAVLVNPVPTSTAAPVIHAVPVGLSIPAIGVDESVVVPLDRLPSGELAAPEDYNRVGWFVGGPVPGDTGPAVIAGHVDSRTGPKVFFRLKELRSGDAVIVRRSDGVAVRFTVDKVLRVPKSDFPTGLIYAPTPGVGLRLITCGGSFDYAVRSYRDNIVVFASVR